jgi:PAS domain S-box-containing protein
LNPSLPIAADRESALQASWQDNERVFRREWRAGPDGKRRPVLVVVPAAEQRASGSLDLFAHEYGLKDELEGAWALRPLDLARENGRAVLVLEDVGGEPLEALVGAPMDAGRFLDLAIGIAASVGKLHQRGFVHKDIRPANILVNCPDGTVRLTGFGLASQRPRERQAPEPPEFIAGTLAYMAPEQTGRMNRSIDYRSDLYALGVVFYRMLTGHLPFTASDPLEWVHCHIARKPVAPRERSESVPVPVSGIIMKLLAKTAEERYQTATGVQSDLRRCLDEWERNGRIESFLLGEHDTPDRLLIPEKLYGRARDVETLLAAFDRVVNSGSSELVLVSGYAGIGKSSVVHELHKVLIPSRGLFASGKFDQYKRDIPYSTVVQAFQSLVRSLLGRNDAELGSWRQTLVEALGPNGRLIVDLIPELNLIIGEQPPVAELEPQQAQGRFQLVLRRFIGVFARPEHPLALFLDDLQWLDSATLDLIEHLLTHPDVRHLLLIGAYRDNEVDSTHPLMRKLEAIKRAGARIEEITLAPLAREHLGQLIADALRCEPGRTAPLAGLVHDKTAGNPFFAIQFLRALGQEGLLSFDHGAAHWSWDLGRIHAKGYTDNVVDLMVGKVTRLPAETRNALELVACLGNSAELPMLSIVLQASEENVHAVLWPAVRQELLERLPGAYRFVHDRIQEAAYSLIPGGSQAETHLLIGRVLIARTPKEKLEETIFEIVNQLNRGAALMSARDERERLAELNLLAGRRARASSAYSSALAYLTAGAALLPEDSWKRRHELTFAIEVQRAECEFLTGSLAEAEHRLEALATRVADTVERATVACLRADLYTALDQSSHAIAVGLDYLRHLGIEWSPHPTDEEARCEYERIWSQLGGRTIESLIELPLMTDPASLATLDVLAKIVPPAFYTDANLLALIICRGVNLSLERGNCDASCSVYEWLSMVAGPHFGDYRTAVYRFGQLGYDLVEGRGLTRFQARTFMDFGGSVLPWTRHVRAGRDLIRRAFEAANKIGDLNYAAYCGNQLNTSLLTAGDPLAEAEREAEHGLAFAQKMRFGLVIDFITSQLGLIRTLRGLTPTFGRFDDEEFEEARIERRFSENPDLAFAECFYWIRKLQARCFAGDYASAVAAALRAQRVLWSSPSQLETAEYHLYGALSHAASCDSAAAGERQQHLDALAAHHKQLQIWAANCPENFENRAALVGAEIARIEGRQLDAERLYEQAILSARANAFVHNEAIAYERAAAFYRTRGLNEFADLYLRHARNGYLRWGADGKVRHLENMHPHLSEEARAPAPNTMAGTPVEHLDLATVIRVSQAVSGEIVLEKMLDTLMRTAMAQAGAERSLLVLLRGTDCMVAAAATTSGDGVTVQLRDEIATADALPESVLQYVMRRRESVILDDAVAEPSFAADPYISRHRARSILCLPLLNQAKLIGALYLENNLAPRVFAPARLAVLKLLASQAAISLENSRLYRDLAEREAKIRQLVDSNIIGIFIWDFDGRILDANDAFLRMVNYDRDDLVAGRIRWIELTPPDWRDQNDARIAKHKTSGHFPPYEKEYTRKDGTRVPVLMGGATFERGGSQGMAYVVDLTERKRAEEALREGERRYREAQMELAHANRLAMMGQLTASIAHEVNQPITGVVTNAQAGLRFLEGGTIDLGEVRQILEDIVKGGNRAGEVVGRIRDLIKKEPPRNDRLDINEAIPEIIEFVRGETSRSGVQVKTALAEHLPHIRGDRVQLQQVMLNLILNAVEAMAEMSQDSSSLLITTGEVESGGVLVSVRDTGPGLPPVALERLFEPFHTTKPNGMGIGLSICRSIVEAHGGRLWASANTPRGAVFQFTLPVDREPPS